MKHGAGDEHPRAEAVMRGASVAFLGAALVALSGAGCEEGAPPESGPGRAGRGDGGVPGLLDGGDRPGDDGGGPARDGGQPGADGAVVPPGGDAAVIPPGDCPTFDEDVAPILRQSCALAGCHGGAGTAGLTLEPDRAWAALVGVASTERPDRMRVAPGDPGRSYLMEKLLPNPSVGGRMPLGTPGGLAAHHIETVRSWIAAGAPRSVDDGSCDDPPPPPPDGVASVTIEGGPVTLGVGELRPLAAVARDADGEVVAAPVAWRLDAEDRAYVDGRGNLLGIAPGQARVVARADGVESAPVEVTVTAASPPAARFRADVLPRLRAECATAGCHVDDVEPGDLRFDRGDARMHEELTEEAETYRSMRRVRADRPEESFLFLKITRSEPPAGARMPFGRAPLAAEDVSAVLRWILAGAPDD